MENPSASENYDQYITVPGYSPVSTTGSWWAPNPTRVSRVTVKNDTGSTITIRANGQVTLKAITEVYNCSTKKTETPYIINSQKNVSYGYRASTKGKIKITTETKTFLVKT